MSYIDKNVGLCERTKGFSNLPQEGQDAPVAWTKSEGVTGGEKGLSGFHLSWLQSVLESLLRGVIANLYYLLSYI